MKSSKAKALFSGIMSFGFVPLALFVSAGTIHYWQAWVYLGVLFVSSIPLMLLILSNPLLRESRTRSGPMAEKRRVQKIIVVFAQLPGVSIFIVPGLDRRFGWSSMPLWLCVIGNLVVLVSMWMSYRVLKENSFGSAIVEVTKDQKVISTGPYSVVRHPMYSGAMVFSISTSFALGSWWTLIPAVLMTLGLVWRLLDEEKFLAQNLPGYEEYCAKVRWRLIPGVF